MARSRNIKPSFFKNEDLAELPYEYRLLFIGLWTLADREGRLEDRPKRIKMEIFPGDDVNVEKGLQALSSMGFITRYSVQASAYIEVPNFIKHQSPHHKEVPSTIPKPEFLPPKHEHKAPDLPPHASPQKPQIDPPCEGGLTALNPDSLIPDSGILNPEPLQEQRRTPASRASRLTEESLPPDWKAFCQTDRPDLDPERVFAKFSDYWRAKPGKAGQKLDWLATWRNWVREERKANGNSGNTGKFDPIAAARSMLAGELATEKMGARPAPPIFDSLPAEVHDGVPGSGGD